MVWQFCLTITLINTYRGKLTKTTPPIVLGDVKTNLRASRVNLSIQGHFYNFYKIYTKKS